MSFELNGPRIKPMIQESQHMQNNGGGGNLGYFQRQKKDKKKKDTDVDLFETGKDSFEAEIQDEDSNNDLSKIKDFFSDFVEKFKKPLGKPIKENPFE